MEPKTLVLSGPDFNSPLLIILRRQQRSWQTQLKGQKISVPSLLPASKKNVNGTSKQIHGPRQ